MEGHHSAVSDIPLVTLSPEGIFKYVLIQGKVYENSQ